MRPKLCVMLCVLAATAIMSGPAFGQLPSFRGYTGLVIIPTADALCKGSFNVGLFFEDVASGTVNDIVGNYGIAPNLEIGFDRFRANDDSDAQTLLNAKYEFMPETSDRPGLAAGVIDITNDLETTVYVVASKSFGYRLGEWEGEIVNPRIHVGLGAGQLNSLFLGGSAWLGQRVQLMAEWDSRNINVGARWRVTPSFAIHAGGLNLTDREGSNTSPNDTASFGVGFSFSQYY